MIIRQFFILLCIKDETYIYSQIRGTYTSSAFLEVKKVVAYSCIFKLYIHLVLQYNHVTTIKKINYGMW